MVFTCNLCGIQSEEWVYLERHCTKCQQIRRVISLYSIDKVLETLRYVYLRDEEDKVENRTKRHYNLRTRKASEELYEQRRASP
jgi:predicted ATP-dependent serine protease